MNSFGDKFRVLLAVLFSASILAAGEAEERELGDKAFFSGDALTAVSHYRSAQILSDQETLTEAWAQNTLKLGKAQLFAGDIAGARATLSEFRQRHSARSAGTLDADLLAAEGKYDAAEDLYLKMESSGDNELRSAAAFGRACLLLRRGKSAAAAAIFQQLADGNSAWRYPARRELAYTMIRMKQYAGALKQLELIPESQRGVSYSLLSLLAKVHSGDMDEFKQSWRKVVSRQLRRPDPLSCELLFAAAAVAMKQQDKMLAVELLKEADKFAPTGETRRNILKQLINFQHTFDPDGAAKSALIYAGLFPADPERFDVLTNAASILAGEKKFSGSISLLQHIIRNTGFTNGQRFQAAMRGAGYAEHGSDIKTAAEFFQAAVAFAPDAKAMMNCRRRYVEFLLRHRDYASAMKELRTALKSGREDGKDDFKFLLLEAAVRDNDLKTASEMATALLKSENLYYRGRAHYELGNIAAQRGDHAAARREFLKAAAVREAEQYAVAARYSAALTAFKLGEFRSAGTEALALAVDNPAFAHSPQALFIGYRSARQLNDEKLKLQCARLLREKYPRSSAFAVCALQDAADRAAANRDFSGALAELDVLEQQFSNDQQIVTESMLMRIELLKLSGRKNDAVDTAQQLLNRYPGSAAAYYAAMQGGNICFGTSRFKEAIAFFEQAGKLRREGLEHDMALARSVEVMIHTRDNRVIAACEALIFQSKFPQIRLRMRYYRGLALEFAGNKDDALQSYQEMLNEAILCREKGIPFSRNLCVRGATAALQLVSASRRRAIFERGIRIIGCCRILELNKEGMDPDQLQQELERKFSANIKRR